MHALGHLFLLSCLALPHPLAGHNLGCPTATIPLGVGDSIADQALQPVLPAQPAAPLVRLRGFRGGVPQEAAELVSGARPAMWVAIPYQRLHAIVEIVGGSADANDLGHIQLLLDGSPLDNGQHLAGPGEIRLDGSQSIFTFRFTLPCPPLGRHLLQARYVQGGRWSGISAPLRFEVVPPTAPRIIAASQAGCPPIPLVQQRFFQARDEQIVLKLANVLPDTRVLAEIDGRPVQCHAVANGCCIELSLRKWTQPGIHRLVVRSVAESDCAITSEPSDEVLFQYAVTAGYIDGLDACAERQTGPGCACPPAREGRSGTDAEEPGRVVPFQPPLTPPGELEELVPPLQSPLRPIPPASESYGPAMKIESGAPDEESTLLIRKIAFQADPKQEAIDLAQLRAGRAGASRQQSDEARQRADRELQRADTLLAQLNVVVEQAKQELNLAKASEKLAGQAALQTRSFLRQLQGAAAGTATDLPNPVAQQAAKDVEKLADIADQQRQSASDAATQSEVELRAAQAAVDLATLQLDAAKQHYETAKLALGQLADAQQQAKDGHLRAVNQLAKARQAASSDEAKQAADLAEPIIRKAAEAGALADVKANDIQGVVNHISDNLGAAFSQRHVAQEARQRTDQQAQNAVAWKSRVQATAAAVDRQVRQIAGLRESFERVGQWVDDLLELRNQAELDEQEANRLVIQADQARSTAANDLAAARNVRQSLDQSLARIHTSLSGGTAARDQAVKSATDAEKNISTTELRDGATRARRDATQAAAAVQAVVANDKRAAELTAAAEVAVQRAEQFATETTQAWREARDTAARLKTLRVELQTAENEIRSRLTEARNADTQAKVQVAEAAARSIRDRAVRTRAAVRSARDQGAAHQQTALDRAGKVSRLAGQVADTARQVEQLATDSQNQATQAKSAAARAHSQTQASAQRIVGWIIQKSLELTETRDRLALRLRHAQDGADRIDGLARNATSDADQAQRDALEAANRARAAAASQSQALGQADLAATSAALARAAAAAERQRASSIRLEDAALAQARATVAEFHAQAGERWAATARGNSQDALGHSDLASQAAAAAEIAAAKAAAGAATARQQQESAQEQVERGGKALRELEECLRLMKESRDKLQGSTGQLTVEVASQAWATTQTLANRAMPEATRVEFAARAVEAAIGPAAQATTVARQAALEAQHAQQRADEAAGATATAAGEAEQARQAAQKEQADAAETARLDRELEVRRAIAAVDELKKGVADKLGKPDQLKQLDVERTITFFSAAHLPLRDFGPGGEVYDQEGLVIYEDMQFTYRDNGEYSVHFKAGTPAVPVTLYLQILVRKAPDGPWHTISLEPLQLPVARSAGGKPQRGVVVKHVTGHSSALARQPGKVCDIRRDASARFGFGVAALGHEER